MPYLEDRTVTLIGAITENPSFELNSALHFKCIVVGVLKSLDKPSLETKDAKVLESAVSTEIKEPGF